VACSNLANKHEKLFAETQRVLYEGIDVIYFNNYCLGPLGLHSFGLTVRPGFVGFFQRELRNYDLLHLDGYYSSDVLAGTYFCRKYDIPYVIQARGTMRPIYSSLLAKHTYHVLFGRRILERCALFIASSSREASDYNALVSASQTVVVIPNGINASDYAKLPEKGGFRRRHGIAEPKVVTYLGRIHWSKGVDHLVRALAGSRFRRETRLLIIGPDDGYRAKVANLARELGLAHSVTFIDTLTGEQKLEAYVDTDAVVYAGQTESFGMVPFEAAMCGVPAITSAGTACGELLSSFGAGFVVPYGDVPKLAQAIDGILENRQETAQKVSVAREKIKEGLCWEKIAQQYEEAYSSVVGGQRAGRN
jgi:glycosyltransferase involved in cell wall biosynthesis